MVEIIIIVMNIINIHKNNIISGSSSILVAAICIIMLYFV